VDVFFLKHGVYSTKKAQKAKHIICTSNFVHDSKFPLIIF